MIMKRWEQQLSNKKLDKIYNDFLYSMDQVMTCYIGYLLVDKHIDFPDDILEYKIRASKSFHESVTSIKTIRNLKYIIDNNDFSNIYIAQSIVSLVNILDGFIQDISDVLGIKPEEVKTKVTKKYYNHEYIFSSGVMKKIFYIAEMYNIDNVITHYQAALYINTIINTRHMIVHSRGCFDELYKNGIVNKWHGYSHGDKLKFKEEDFDAVFWFFMDHAKSFIKSIDIIAGSA